MGNIDFLDGDLTGKYGKAVGASWKGIHYVRRYKKPKNPRTIKQVAIRTVFKRITRIARALNPGVLKPYTFPEPVKMTPFNRMLKINREMFEDKKWDPSKLKIFDGPLFNPGISQLEIHNHPTIPGIENMVINYETVYTGEEGEKAIAIVYDEVTGMVLHAVNDRHVGEIEVKLKLISPVDKSKLHVYLVFSRPPAEGTNEAGMVSGTAYSRVN